MRLKIIIISLILSLPFWWGINALADNLEDFWFTQEISKNPELLSAQVAQSLDLNIEEEFLRKERERKEFLKLLADNLDPSTKSAISVEIDEKGNKRILFEKNSLEVLPIASLTKLITAAVIFDLDETYDFSTIIPITKQAVAQEGTSKYGEIKEGEFLSIETLINIMLVESSNDAAYALAEVIDKDSFVALMNLYAEKAGFKDSHFVNPTGLDPADAGQGNVSTAWDIVKLSQHIIKQYPRIFEITSQNSYEALNPDGSLHHFISENTNELLGEVPNIIGGKTGWSIEARGCLLLIIKDRRQGEYTVNVILGAEDRFEEMRKLVQLVSL